MISALSAGGLAFVGTSSRNINTSAPEAEGVNADKNRQSGNVALAQRQERAAESETVRPVEESGETQKPSAGGEELTEEEERIVQQLKQRDSEVRAHEQAHASAGGSYAGPPSYEYTVGPDGKRYATSGEVQIDASPVRDNPEATIRKMDIVIRAALAPAEPSSQDLQVAKQAQATRAKAQAELQQKRLEEQKGGNEKEDDVSQDGSLRLTAQEAYEDAGALGDLIKQASAQEVFGLSLVV